MTEAKTTDALMQTPDEYRTARWEEIGERLSLAQARLLGLDQPEIRGLYGIVVDLQYARERAEGLQQMLRVLLAHYRAAVRALVQDHGVNGAVARIAEGLVALIDTNPMEGFMVGNLCAPEWIAQVMVGADQQEREEQDGTQDDKQAVDVSRD